MIVFEDEIKGKVKRYKETKNNLVDQVLYFNSRGEVIKREDFTNGKLFSQDIMKDHLTYRTIYKNNKTKHRLESVLDINNKIIESTTYDSEGRIINEVKNEINKDKKVVKEIKGKHEYRYEYDDKGNEIQKVKILKGKGIIKTQISTFDDKGNQLTWKKYDDQGNLIKYKIYKYNLDGKLVRKTKFYCSIKQSQSKDIANNFLGFYKMMEPFKLNLNGDKRDIILSLYMLNTDTLYEYDKFGNTILEEEYRYRADFSNEHLTLCEGSYSEYNEKNLLIKTRVDETHTDWDWSTEMIYEYMFNREGKIFSKKRGELDTTYFHYNELGELEEELIIAKTESAQWEEKIKYDKQGNKIWSSEITKDLDGSITKEEITSIEIDYYE